MDVDVAVASRRSVRAFLDREVSGDVVRRVLSRALRAPSGGNLQPWHLHAVGGAPLSDLKARMREVLADPARREAPEYTVYPRDLVSPYRERRFEVGEALYRRLGIPREDKDARRRWFDRNFAFFGAPIAVFCTVDRRMGPPQWADLGMLFQTIMLLLRAEGLDSCAQECWALHPHTVRDFLAIPPERMVYAAIAIGHADPEAAVNGLIADRAPLDEVATFVGL